MPSKTKQVAQWCQGMQGAVLDHPFGPETAVYKVEGKMFALVAIDESPGRITLKALPEEGEALRAQYSFISGGYYMNKRHWITVDLVAEAPMDEIRELIAESHRLVACGLSKKKRVALGFDDCAD